MLKRSLRCLYRLVGEQPSDHAIDVGLELVPVLGGVAFRDERHVHLVLRVAVLERFVHPVAGIHRFLDDVVIARIDRAAKQLVERVLAVAQLDCERDGPLRPRNADGPLEHALHAVLRRLRRLVLADHGVEAARVDQRACGRVVHLHGVAPVAERIDESRARPRPRPFAVDLVDGDRFLFRVADLVQIDAHRVAREVVGEDRRLPAAHGRDEQEQQQDERLAHGTLRAPILPQTGEVAQARHAEGRGGRSFLATRERHARQASVQRHGTRAGGRAGQVTCVKKWSYPRVFVLRQAQELHRRGAGQTELTREAPEQRAARRATGRGARHQMNRVHFSPNPASSGQILHGTAHLARDTSSRPAA